MANDNLVNLLYYTDKDPLAQTPLTTQEKTEKVFEKLIKIIPRVEAKETATSIVVVRVVSGLQLTQNDEFKRVMISVEVFVPLTQWIIKDTNLRPFAILGEIQKSLNGKTINGLGKMTGGDFQLSFITEELACYEANYDIVSYD